MGIKVPSKLWYEINFLLLILSDYRVIVIVAVIVVVVISMPLHCINRRILVSMSSGKLNGRVESTLDICVFVS